MQPALLLLQDGTVFAGVSIGVSGYSVGEVVFNTSMTGYQEILTDPSYAKQIITLTYPHIGNTGTTHEDDESDGVFASGLIVKNLPNTHSNWRAGQSLGEFLIAKKVVALAGIDTRKLSRMLRDGGAQKGIIVADSAVDMTTAASKLAEFSGIAGLDLAKQVSTKKSYQWTQGVWSLEQGYRQGSQDKFIVAYDFGVKRNILRMLASRGCKITVVPATTSAEQVLEMNPDGVFLSNGPGDPEPCTYAITAIQKLLAHKMPLFGICLGYQLLALASGASSEKMKFGHHGANHPVQEKASGKVLITSQNHSFAIVESTLPAHSKATHHSLFDHSLQGIARSDCPAIGFQGHPEASPGPHDIAPLFDQFIAMLCTRQNR